MILNLMLGKKRGGLEQAALDYAEALALAALPALTVISPQAWVEAPLVAANMPHESLANFASWDPLAARRLRKLAKRTHASSIICHGNRALTLALHAFPEPRTLRIIAVAHNYSNRRFHRADGCFAITQHLLQHLVQHSAKNISLMPNMVRSISHAPRAAFRTPPVIGLMGRFVAKKGFEVAIDAFAILASRGIDFRAVIGGDGEDADALRQRVAQHVLNDRITFTGWVKNKSDFFEAMDIFVLPSHHEPFGIVLIEAMGHGVPVISTDSEGPSEILHHGADGLICKRADAQALADAITELLSDRDRAKQMAETGEKLVQTEYSMQAMAQRLKLVFKPQSL